MRPNDDDDDDNKCQPKNLLSDHGQYFQLNAVEFVETSPSAS